MLNLRAGGFAALSCLAAAGMAVALSGLAAPAGVAETPDRVLTAGATVDYEGFASLVETVAPLRAERLVSLETFNRMKDEPGTIVLDTRSAEAFAAGHVEGAVHLNFSDFTEAALADRIPDRTTRILIYCNNNFLDDAPPVVLKRAPLALNVPTFVNLWGYGYENVYELADLVETSDPRVGWASGA